MNQNSVVIADAGPAPVTPPVAPVTPPVQPPQTPPVTPPVTPPPVVAQPTKADLIKFETEFNTTGKLSDASYAELETKHGISRSMVDSHIAGSKATQAQAEAEVMSVVGGKSEFEKITAWASKSLNPAEIEAYNKIANGSDKEATKLALSALKGKYVASQGQEPTLLSGLKGGSSDVYRSVAELTADMNNPKYKLDSAFRTDVQNKLSRSNIM